MNAPLRELDIQSPRPLADAAMQLERHFCARVAYEDVPYLHASDLVEDEHGRTIPRGGRLNVEYPSGIGFDDAIESVVRSHNRARNPGVFRAAKSNVGYQILPTEYRSESGDRELRQPLLTTEVALTTPTANALQVLEQVTREIEVVRREQLDVGTIPTNAFAQRTIEGQDFEGSAIDVLSAVLSEVRGNLSLQLLSITGRFGFVLNIHAFGTESYGESSR